MRLSTIILFWQMKKPRRWGELPHDQTAFSGSTDTEHSSDLRVYCLSVSYGTAACIFFSITFGDPELKRREHHHVSTSSWVTERKPHTRKAAFLILLPGGVRSALVRNGASSSPWNFPHQHLTTSSARSELWVLIPSQGQSRAKLWNREDTRCYHRICFFKKGESLLKNSINRSKIFYVGAIKNRNMGEALIENCPNSYYIKIVLKNTA